MIQEIYIETEKIPFMPYGITDVQNMKYGSKLFSTWSEPN